MNKSQMRDLAQRKGYQITTIGGIRGILRFLIRGETRFLTWDNIIWLRSLKDIDGKDGPVTLQGMDQKTRDEIVMSMMKKE